MARARQLMLMTARPAPPARSRRTLRRPHTTGAGMPHSPGTERKGLSVGRGRASPDIVGTRRYTRGVF